MSAIGDFFIDHPGRILIVGLVFLTLFVVMLRRAGRPNSVWGWSLGAAAIFWLLYALWEWGIQDQSPDADIRIDLFLIYPLLAILSVAALVYVVRNIGGRTS